MSDPYSGYLHQSNDGKDLSLPPGKAVCVGRNYVEHAKELNNPVPANPLLFIKPYTAMTGLTPSIQLPVEKGPCHFETELTVLIGSPLTQANEAQAADAIAGIGLGLDLTLRDLQDELKKKGHPWEIAKSFDGSCPLSAFISPRRISNIEDTEYRLWVNGELRQHGQTRQMITAVNKLLSYCSQHFTLLPGDVVLTGTPAGVGVLQRGDLLKFQLDTLMSFETQVI
ncbi:fumarylacetoacetate hydrolase family protein [Motiliproteus sp. MSK22-1]|uniref:fumarylacetoacetate hydrolase family protein n=1 Tax=Motiliproteus sp. MSK22-1 TaxID=1897630 RepID=UPI000977407E|nr:fumarylacetoacetate hydrolase family protein [Motiliproteus sp. MSK22-1]OMH39548.1 hypothetical protein BGP75_02870 [Motiliproteus sp. MSK22-1]